MGAATVIFLLLAVLGWGLAAVLDKACLRYMDPSSAFYLRSLANIALFTPLVLWKLGPTRQALTGGSKWGPLLVFSSVVVTMSGVYFYLRALSGGEATKIVPLTSAYPFVTFLLAVLFLGENFTLNKLAGTLLLAGGVYFISK